MPTARPISIDGRVYASVMEASRVMGMNPNTVWQRVVSNSPLFKEWYYADGLPAPRPLTERGYKTRRKVLWVAYTLTHLPSGKLYVGMSGSFVKRRAQHLSLLRRNLHPSPKLQELWNSDSADASWKWTMVVCPTREHAYELEQGEIDVQPADKLLNNSLNARSAISHHMQDADVARRREEARKQWLENNREAYSRRASRTTTERWAQPGAREAIIGAGNPNAKPLEIDGIRYDGVKAASVATGILQKTIFNRVRNPNFPGYRFLDRGKGPQDDPYAKRASSW